MNTRQQLMATKPKREDFPSEEEFEEALGYWMGHQGRILALTQISKETDAKLAAEVEAKLAADEQAYRESQMEIHNEVMSSLTEYLTKKYPFPDAPDKKQ